MLVAVRHRRSRRQFKHIGVGPANPPFDAATTGESRGDMLTSRRCPGVWTHRWVCPVSAVFCHDASPLICRITDTLATTTTSSSCSITYPPNVRHRHGCAAVSQLTVNRRDRPSPGPPLYWWRWPATQHVRSLPFPWRRCVPVAVRRPTTDHRLICLISELSWGIISSRRVERSTTHLFFDCLLHRTHAKPRMTWLLDAANSSLVERLILSGVFADVPLRPTRKIFSRGPGIALSFTWIASFQCYKLCYKLRTLLGSEHGTGDTQSSYDRCLHLHILNSSLYLTL